MNGKAQIAVEYVLIIVFILSILVAGMYIFRGYAMGSRDKIIENKVELISNAFIDNAREIYFLGEGSKKVVTIEMPDQVENIIAFDAGGKEFYLIFNILTSSGQKELFYKSDVLIKKDSITSIHYDDPASCHGADSCDFYYFRDNEISAGIKNFMIEAKKDDINYIDIEMVSLE